MTSALLALLARSGLNRARGNKTWLKRLGLKGRPLFYVAPAMALVALLVAGDARLAVAWGLGFLIWGAPAWGHLIGLGRHVPDRAPSRLEATLLEVAGGNVHLALLMRMCFCLPAFVAVGWLVGAPLAAALYALAFAAFAVAAYEMAWRVHPLNPIWIAELIVGAGWGFVIAALGGPS